MIGTHGLLWRRVHIVVYVCCAVWGVCRTALPAAQKSDSGTQWAAPCGRAIRRALLRLH